MVRSYEADVSVIGETNAAIPMESKGSVILEPQSSNSDALALLTATIATVNSGKDVPNPDMVEPTIACGTLSWYAISQAYFTVDLQNIRPKSNQPQPSRCRRFQSK